MRVRAALLALACAAWGGAASQQEDVSQSTHSDSREKRQALLNPGAGSGCADWSLLNYLLYYYLIQAQTTDAAQIQHQQTDQMAAALLKLRRARGTDPLPTLLSQPAGQAAIITLLQKVTQGDTGQLLLLLADIRDQGRAAALGAAQGLRQGPGGVGPGLGLAPGSLGQQRPVFGSGPQQPVPAVRSSVLAPSTSLHVTTSTLVTTILLKKTKTVPAVRGDTPTTVQHVHTVTHVLTATGLQTDTIVITPTLVISAGTTRLYLAQ
ncbi:hypothetical protein FJT64_004196 [Amphibalanus amphitrite]|uniref:Uncharacterized protein n=1 Tax=Amphibalanus amphitrite TaxID=1232801 RepID=A0A6A4VZT5_AMPAM|nr:hypothetical protein FJT64_004196 [Amphibalanus amphitrite]